MNAQPVDANELNRTVINQLSSFLRADERTDVASSNTPVLSQVAEPDNIACIKCRKNCRTMCFVRKIHIGCIINV